MRILFCVNDYQIEILGVGYLSSALKKAGHETRLVKTKDWAHTCAFVKEWQPDILAWSLTTGWHTEYLKENRMLRQWYKRGKSVFGGPHATYMPEMINEEGVDAVLRGECEQSFIDYLKVVEVGLDGINRTVDLYPLEQDLDSIEFPDRELLYSYPENLNNPIANVMISRGCPFACSFCMPGNTMILTTTGMKEISNISNNEYVLVAKGGKFERVKQIHKRFYTGEIIKITLKSMKIPLRVTPEHKILRYKYKKASYKKAKDISIMDKIVIPLIHRYKRNPAILSEIGIRKILGNKVGLTHFGMARYKKSKTLINDKIKLNKNFWRLAGYYVSEGNIDNSGIRFTFNKNELVYQKEVENYIIEIFGIKTGKIFRDNTCQIYIDNYLVRDIFEKLFGKGANNKKIPLMLFEQPIEYRMNFIECWNNGDGDKFGQLTTVSQGLAMQGFLLAWGVGLRPSLYERPILNSYINGRIIKTENKCYMLHLKRDNKNISVKDGLLLIPIEKIEKEIFNGYVYNLGLAGNESFTANLFGVHNCYNSVNLELYKGQKTVRYRSVKNVIDECFEIKKKYPKKKMIFFQDDEFVIRNINILSEFLEVYKEKIRLPFHCQFRAEQITEDKAEALKKAGCISVTFAIESGNELIRNNLLKKHLKDTDIYNCAEILKRNGLKFRVENMIGIPGETVDEALETLDMNIKISPSVSWCALFQPYPKTELGDLCKSMLLWDGSYEGIEKDFFTNCPIKRDRAREFNNLQKIFGLVVEYPILRPLVRGLIKLPEMELMDWVSRKFKKYCYDRRLYEVIT